MNFEKIISGGYFYQDRTAFIEKCENTASTLFCVRPRRMGKTLWLDTLANYYDIKRKDRFEKLFSHLYIGKNPTGRQNSYLILHLDFSTIQVSNDIKEIENSFHRYITTVIREFLIKYKDCIADFPVAFERENAIDSMNSLISVIKLSEHKLYILIDEYDNFTNELISTNRTTDYARLVTGDGLLKSFFKVIKSGNIGAIDRTFVTGVTPVTLTDMSSAYNISTPISLSANYNNLFGFTEKEVESILEPILAEVDMSSHRDEILSIMRHYYNGYKFSKKHSDTIYNPTLTIFFLNKLIEERGIPEQLYDRNLEMDGNKLDHITKLSSVHDKVFRLLENEEKISISHLVEDFKLSELLTMDEQSERYLWSYLFYYGILTFGGMDAFNTVLKIPNNISRHFYYDRIRQALFPAKLEASDVQKEFFIHLDLPVLQTFLEKTVLPYLSNRDYIRANEVSMKIMFLSLMLRDDLYIIDSEKEILRNYSDLLYIGRGETRKRFGLKDILIEFKFVKISETNLSQEEIRVLAEKELESLPGVKEKLEEAENQLGSYKEKIEDKFYKHNRFFSDMSDFAIHPLCILFIGFERVLVRASY
ncbi:MAG: AAA family ATPase [Leptospiraceae bacterium]|nr:AAA family ATPase [Leptospiraceae bacterium]